MSLIPQFKTELQYIPTVKACLKLSWVDCFCPGLKGPAGSLAGVEKFGIFSFSQETPNMGHFGPGLLGFSWETRYVTMLCIYVTMLKLIRAYY